MRDEDEEGGLWPRTRVPVALHRQRCGRAAPGSAPGSAPPLPVCGGSVPAGLPRPGEPGLLPLLAAPSLEPFQTHPDAFLLWLTLPWQGVDRVLPELPSSPGSSVVLPWCAGWLLQGLGRCKRLCVCAAPLAS